MIKRIIFSIVSIFIIIAFMTIPASANIKTHDPLCNSAFTSSHCLNDWNGVFAGQVKMYQYGASNEQFQLFLLTSMCGNGHVTSTCPFNNHNIDQQLLGAVITAVEYTPFAECVDTSETNGYAYLGACPDRSGAGGSVGVVMVTGSNTGCNSNSIYYLIDRYWSDYYGIQVGLTGQDSNGGIVNFDSPFTCWHALT